MNTAKKFHRFFEVKGNVAPIAEKADKNFILKEKNNVNLQERLWYFAIGHVFKQLDTKAIFDYKVNEATRESKPQKFTSLTSDNFSFLKKIKSFIGNIRNINSHYIHDFSVIKLNTNIEDANNDNSFMMFLKEAFELALIHIYSEEKGLKYSQFIDDKTNDKKLVEYIRDKFYSLNDSRKNLTSEEKKASEEYKKFRTDFLNKTKSQAINDILFIDNEADFDWTLYETHKVFTIKEGKYLSFDACLFLLTMFLYKNEANELISKIKGFKRSDDNTFRSKRNLFSFYSKKFSSQDIDSEEGNLIKFRDIVQYLNLYPKHWNSELEFDAKIPQMTKPLKDKIVEMEIERCFPKKDEKDELFYPKYDRLFNDSYEKFKIYAKYQIFGKKFLGKAIENEYIKQDFSDFELDIFSFEINKTKKYKDSFRKEKSFEKRKKDLEYKSFHKKSEEDFLKNYQKNLKDIQRIIKEEEEKLNLDTQKLQKRIAQNMLHVQYGRNQDRFMDFAVRFLAEKKYFGNEAEFKMYQFHTTDEQNNCLATQGKVLTKKEFDNLKYHQGKLVVYKSFEEQLKKYPDWDTPFVIENNSFHVKINFCCASKIISIQRNALIYLLEHALYGNNAQTIENAGKDLLIKYFVENETAFDEKYNILKTNTEISKDEKTELKKFFPKRLLHNYYKDETSVKKTKTSSLQKILDDANEAETRYQKLLVKVKREETEYKAKYPEDDTVALVANFEKRNKGKQFKLRFMRKAWQLMYFKDAYLKQIQADNKHHKSYNITRDEFNDFSKWLYAFEEIPVYKEYLSDMFAQKTFFVNKEFKDLFDRSTTFENLYLKTKERYTNWLITNDTALQKNFELKNYETLLSRTTLFININRFIDFLVREGKLTKNSENMFEYKSLENWDYLIEKYYFKEKLEKSEYKTCGKLFNKLRTVKLEDCLLYEMAIDYLQTDKTIADHAKKHIRVLQTKDVIIEVPDINTNNGGLFKLEIPFNKLMAFEELFKQKEEEENEPKNRKTSFLSNIQIYLKKLKEMSEKTKDKREIEKGISDTVTYFNANKGLKFEHLNKIYSHLISTSAKFTKVELELEKYFIVKNKVEIPNEENRITFDDIDAKKEKVLSKYFSERIRNKAFHFGVPIIENKPFTYKEKLEEIETKFIQNEVKPLNKKSFDEYEPEMKSVLIAFLETLHNAFYEKNYSEKGKKGEKDGKKKVANAKNKYFNEVVIKK